MQQDAPRTASDARDAAARDWFRDAASGAGFDLAARAKALGPGFLPLLSKALVDDEVSFTDAAGARATYRPLQAIAVRVLAAMEDPAADAVLRDVLPTMMERGLDVGALDPRRHRGVLLEAAWRRPGIPGVLAAWSKADASDDDAARMLLARLSTSTGEETRHAARWLARHRRAAALQGLSVDAWPQHVADAFFDAIRETGGPAPEDVRFFAVDPPTHAGRRSAWTAFLLADEFDVLGVDPALDAAVERWILGSLERERPYLLGGAVAAAWRRVASLRSVALVERRSRRSEDAAELRPMFERLERLLFDAGWPEITPAIRRLPLATFETPDLAARSPTLAAAKRRAAVADAGELAATLEGLEGAARGWFLREAVAPRFDVLVAEAAVDRGAASRPAVRATAEAYRTVAAALLADADHPETGARHVALAARWFRRAPDPAVLPQMLAHGDLDVLREFARSFPKATREMIGRTLPETPDAEGLHDRALLLAALPAVDALPMFDALWAKPRTPRRTRLLVDVLSRIEGSEACDRLRHLAAEPDVARDPENLVLALDRFGRDADVPSLPFIRGVLFHASPAVRRAAAAAAAAFAAASVAAEALDAARTPR
ncbi:MAG TPA: hypothetical protein VEI02_14525 [Planctomycetota bacterium]|nr:hypothetical protein [Planctomycetota bacterium]